MARLQVILVLAALAVALFAFAPPAAAKHIMDRCKLAHQLVHKYGFPKNLIPSLLCIAFRETRYDTSHINSFNTDGSKDYGLFQINNRWWCNGIESPAPNQNLCHVPCQSVLNSMDETMKCVKIMYHKSRDTFEPWITYPYCQKMDMNQFIKGCKY